MLPRRKFSNVQRGAALIAAIALFSLILVGVLYATARGDSPADRDAITARALGMARDALIAQAAMHQKQPGQLPCPAIDAGGEAPLANPCNHLVGRLPWKTLDLPHLVDGYGEDLWYAVSESFTTGADEINSTSNGTITVTTPGAPNNIVAIVFSPGPTLGNQSRDPVNQPMNRASYLEGKNADPAPKNQEFEAGPVTPAFNDRALIITVNMLMPAVEQRVAREAIECLEKFSELPAAGGRYPWPAELSNDDYEDNDEGLTFGRIPEELDNTEDALPGVALPSVYGTLCFDDGWWDEDDWQELLFYAVADAYKPTAPSPLSCEVPGSCLTVNNASDVKVVVIVAGRAISPNTAMGVQTRTSIDNVLSYLETDPRTGINNAEGATSFRYAKSPPHASATINFNDRLACIRTKANQPCP